MALKTYDERLKQAIERKQVYLNEVLYAICNKYGIEDLMEWVQMENMVEFLRDTDPELAPLLTKWLKLKVQHIPYEYKEWLSLMDYKTNSPTLPYVRNLIVRVHIQGFINGYMEDVEEAITIEDVS